MSHPRILVIQLCRLGDILQTTPMLRGLRRERPDAHVTFMLLDGFGAAPVPRHLYDELVLFPFDATSGLTTAVPNRWRDALAQIRAFVESLSVEPFDVTLNVTSSHLSNLLASVIPTGEVHGGMIAPDRTRVVRGPWMTYFWASLRTRAHGCVNLVDLMTWMAGVQSDRRGLEIDVPRSAHDRILGWLTSQGAAGDPLIAVQLGASDERKRWPPERVAATLNRVPASWGRVVFVGTKGERDLVHRARAALERPSLDASGETSVPELAALLGHARLLLTNDTGTMHVASAMGTRIVDLSTGPVFVHETGPYGDGHIAVEPEAACFPCAAGSTCSHLSCRDDFTPDDIAAVVAYGLGVAPPPSLRRARVLRSRFAPSGRLEFVTLTSPGNRESERMRDALARMWETTLPAPGVVRAARSTVTEWPGRETDSLAVLAREAGQAAIVADRLATVSPQEQAAASAQIQESLSRLTVLSQVEQECLPIVAYLQVAIESITEREVDRVAAIYAQELRDAAWRAHVLAALLVDEKTRAA